MKGGFVQVYEQQITAEDGLQLNLYHWVPDAPKASIIIAHGWSEHAGRYHDVANWFMARGYEVHALDHRGHGKSEGNRGHVNRWTDYARDLELLRASVKQETQYLLGHSMGGMISILHALEYPNKFAAMALSGPASDVSIPVSKFKMFLGQTMSAWLPKLSISNDIDPYVVCSDVDVVKQYIADPFTHGKVTTRWFNEYLKTVENVKQRAKDITTPIAIWHGEGDALVEPWVSDNFYEALSQKDKQRTLVKGALHEILLEPTWQNTADEMISWFEKF